MSQSHTTSRQERASPDDAALIQAAQRDVTAFGPLYTRYLDRIYTYMRARTGRTVEAEDLTQQVFMRALDALPRYRVHEGVSVAAWLFRIARNLAIDWQRRQHPTVPWDALPDALHPHALETADGAVWRREAFTQLYALLAGLDPQTREALILRFTAQLTLAEIGAVLGKSEDAARKQITRALHALKEQYHDDTP